MLILSRTALCAYDSVKNGMPKITDSLYVNQDITFYWNLGHRNGSKWVLGKPFYLFTAYNERIINSKQFVCTCVHVNHVIKIKI